MGQIRKQTIYSSVIIYIGFFIGFLNKYFLVRKGFFTPEQNGLVELLTSVGSIMFSFATFGVLSYVFKFHPYYADNLDKKKNDQFFWSVVISLSGFILVAIAAILFRPLIIQKFSARSPLFVDYFYFTFLVAAGSLFFSVFEAFGWFAGRNVFTNFLRETGLRLYQLGCLVLFVTGVVHFDLFITIYSCTFLVIALVLLAVLLRSRQVYFYAGISAVTRKYAGKAANYSVFIYITGIVSQLTLYVDGVFIGSLSKEGLTDVAVYSIAGFIANTIMVPQRSIVAATLPILSKAWKDKNYTEIRRLYYRSSLNLLIIGLVIFFTIWLSLSDMMHAFNFNKSYLAAMPAVFLLGLARIIECGTGINGQIIATSRHWKYEVVAGMILLAVMMPLDYLLIRKYNFIGAAYANLISLLVYNIFRTIVMKVKFNMLPFSRKTLYAVLYLTVLYGVCYLAFRHLYGWAGLIVRSTVFLSAAAAGILLFNLSPDVTAVYRNLLARVSRKK